ncbi:hypothetical protein C8R44DRAFT_760727 [Mycena epipterygia]|nr:hypothetical protein C8R44DRAFT_760727 [Mycena epipterygia]
MDIRVPIELWFDTFRYLPRSSLIPLHAVSRTLHRVSRPLLFRTFAFHPYGADYDGAGGPFQFLLPGEVHIKRTCRRLRFWASDAIAPLVHQCTVSPWNYDHMEGVDYTSCHDGGMMLSLFFELLPQFTNIRRLVFFYVEFDQDALISLSSLPNLKTIELEKCSIAGDATPSILLKVEKLSFLHLGPPDELQRIGADKWLPMLDPDILSHLVLFPDRTTTAFFDTLPRLLFPNLHTLSIYVKSWPQLITCRNLPAVRTLCIQQFASSALPPAPEAILFPLLESYKGPPELLAFLDPAAAPRRLHITCPGPHILLPILNAHYAARAHSVTSLELTFDFLTTSAVRPLLSAFPNVAEFRMSVPWDPQNTLPPGEIGYTEQTLYEDLAAGSPFAAGIQSISIHWRLPSIHTRPTIISAARAAKTTLVAAHAALEDVRFSSPGLRYVWGTEQGESVDETDDIPDAWSALWRELVAGMVAGA